MPRPRNTQTIEQRVLPVLVVVFVIALVMGPLKMFKPARQHPQATPTTTEQARESAPVKPRAMVKAPAPVPTSPVYTAQQVRDPLVSLLPMEPPESIAQGASPGRTQPARQASIPPLSLQGVLWGGAEPQAIINGEVYRVGDRIDEVRITGIDRRGVTVEFNGMVKSLATDVPAEEPTVRRR